MQPSFHAQVQDLLAVAFIFSGKFGKVFFQMFADAAFVAQLAAVEAFAF
jgi:hypothetical protein